MQRHMSPQSLSPSRQSRETSLGHIGQSRACKAIFSSNTGTNNGICRRRTCVMASGSDEFCRDKVGAPVEKVAVEGESSISFLGGGGHSVDIKARKDTYILDSGLDCGLELPFTCRGGICGACVGRVVEGEVDQTDIPDLSFTLTEEEQEQGMALLCMARPVSDRIVIETQSDWGYSLGITEWKGATGQIKGKSVEPLMGKKWNT